MMGCKSSITTEEGSFTKKKFLVFFFFFFLCFCLNFHHQRMALLVEIFTISFLLYICGLKIQLMATSKMQWVYPGATLLLW